MTVLVLLDLSAVFNTRVDFSFGAVGESQGHNSGVVQTIWLGKLSVSVLVHMCPLLLSHVGSNRAQFQGLLSSSPVLGVQLLGLYPKQKGHMFFKTTDCMSEGLEGLDVSELFIFMVNKKAYSKSWVWQLD